MMKKSFFNLNLAEIGCGLILLILIFVPYTINLGAFQSHDEKMRNRQSLDSFLAIVEGRWGDVYSSNFGATNLTWARTTAELMRFAWLRWQGVNVSLPETVNYGPPFDPLPSAIFNALVLVIAYWFLRKLLGWPIAALAIAILALDPYLLSEARILRTEAAYALFITLTIICVALYIRTQRRRYLVWAGWWSAWTVATKISGVVLLPMVGLPLAVMVWEQRPGFKAIGWQLKRLAGDILLWGGVTVICTFAIWPTLWVKPLQTLSDLYAVVFFFGVVSKESLDFFYLGRIVAELPASYYLWVLLYKTTPLVWLGLGGLVWVSWRLRRQPGPTGESRWAGMSFPLAGGGIMLSAAVLYTLAMGVATFKTERYMMATVCLLDIPAALGLMMLGQNLYRRCPVKLGGAAIALAVFIAGHGALAWLNYPYYFSYYNPLLGGGRTAVNMVQIGSGEGIDMAFNYLNHQPNPAQQVVVCGTNLPRCEYLAAGQTLLKQETLNPVSSEWIRADYVVTYIFQTQRGDYSAGLINYLEHHPGPAYTATFQGIEYAKVYPAPHAQYVAASKLTGISTLLGYTLNRQTLTAGELLKIKLYWENDGRIDRDMLVQLVDADGYVWSEVSSPFAPGFGGLRAQRGAIIEGQADLPIPAGTPPGRYYLKMGYKNEAGQLVGLFQLPAGGDVIEVLLPEIFTANPNPAHSVNFDIDSNLTLAGYELDRDQAASGESVWLTLVWQAHADVQRDYVINLRLLDASGKEAAYWLGRPVRSGYPTNTWRAGQIVQDPWRLVIPAEIKAGQYQLHLVIFDAQSQQEVAQTSLQLVNVVR